MIRTPKTPRTSTVMRRMLQTKVEPQQMTRRVTMRTMMKMIMMMKTKIV